LESIVGCKVVEMSFKPNTGVLAISIALAMVGSLAVTGLVTTSKTLSSACYVRGVNVEVYWDSQCTQVVGSVDWGSPEPGESMGRTVYIKNPGNARMTLGMSSSSWSPAAAESYLSVNWDRQGATIDVDEVVQATLTLVVSDLITGVADFSFNVVIEGTL
jgi:hypothetical protein